MYLSFPVQKVCFVCPCITCLYLLGVFITSCPFSSMLFFLLCHRWYESLSLYDGPAGLLQRYISEKLSIIVLNSLICLTDGINLSILKIRMLETFCLQVYYRHKLEKLVVCAFYVTCAFSQFYSYNYDCFICIYWVFFNSVLYTIQSHFCVR